MSAGLEVMLELARGTHASVDEGYPLGEMEYLLRHGEGAFQSARFPWSEALHQDLRSLQQARPNPEAVQRVGDVLHTFFEDLGWARVEAEIVKALESTPPREVRVTFRCSAGELCRLPLELLTLKHSGQALGVTAGCHVQWEWPDTASAPETPPAPPEGAFLFAWSTAGGGVNSMAHLRGLQQACDTHRYTRQAIVELADASLKALLQKLQEVQDEGRSVAVLHLLCHGGSLPGPEGGHGLALNAPGGGTELVDPATFAS